MNRKNTINSSSYKRQFDKYSGGAADFDSLFEFEGDELITKKRIHIHKNRFRRMVNAAAVVVLLLAAVIGLSVLGETLRGNISAGENTSGEETGLDDGFADISATAAQIIETPVIPINDIPGLENDYSLYNDYSYSANQSVFINMPDESVFAAADAVISGTVIEKGFAPSDSEDYIYYVFSISAVLADNSGFLSALEDDKISIDYRTAESAELSESTYAYAEAAVEVIDEMVTYAESVKYIYVYSSLVDLEYYSYEMQPDCEYIIPVNMITDSCEDFEELFDFSAGNAVTLAVREAPQIRYTAAGWLFPDCYETLADGAADIVHADDYGAYSEHMVIESSDAEFFRKLNDAVKNAGAEYTFRNVSLPLPQNGVCWSENVYPNLLLLENAQYLILYARPVLYGESEVYFDITYYVSGYSRDTDGVYTGRFYPSSPEDESMFSAFFSY